MTKEMNREKDAREGIRLRQEDLQLRRALRKSGRRSAC